MSTPVPIRVDLPGEIYRPLERIARHHDTTVAALLTELGRRATQPKQTTPAGIEPSATDRLRSSRQPRTDANRRLTPSEQTRLIGMLEQGIKRQVIADAFALPIESIYQRSVYLRRIGRLSPARRKSHA